MAQFVLLLRSKPLQGMSPEEIQSIIGRYKAWREKVGATGQKLHDMEGRVARRNGSSLSVTDGPFTESKEMIGGFFMIEAADYDEALRKSSDCPHLDYGAIEIREIQQIPGHD